jgi:hypothetical protein
MPVAICWIRDLSTCTQDQTKAIVHGEGVVNASVWSPDPIKLPKSAYKRPYQTNSADPEPTTTIALIGVFTATTIPTPTTKVKSAASRNAPALLQRWDVGELQVWDEGFISDAGRAKAIETGIPFALAILGSAVLRIELGFRVRRYLGLR